MTKFIVNEVYQSNWATRLFKVAGCFMLVNTAMLWVRLYSDYQLSILWPAIPAIIALSCAVLGLFNLYSRASIHAPKLAKLGAICSLFATASLSWMAMWIFIASVFGDGIPQPRPPGFMVLIVIFMIGMVGAFLSNSLVFLFDSSHRKLGLLLLVPVVTWCLMLGLAMVKGLQSGISLDYYVNGIQAIAFLGISRYLQTRFTCCND